MALFKRKNSDRGSEPEWLLPLVLVQVTRYAPLLEAAAIEPDLERARLADLYRDVRVQPVTSEVFDSIVEPLDEDSWRRVALQTRLLQQAHLRETVSLLATAVGSAAALTGRLVDHATSKAAHTMSLLCQSRLRSEEYARSLAAAVGCGLKGETPEESAETLERLDYGRLLAEAEAAKGSAEERLAYLKELQEKEEEERYGRMRGKW